MVGVRARGSGGRVAQTLLLVTATAALTLVATTTAALSSPNATVITFTDDAAGQVPNGFHSVDSPQVAFSDSLGRTWRYRTSPSRVTGSRWLSSVTMQAHW